MKKIIPFLILLMFSFPVMAGEIPGQKKNITVDSITSAESIPITSYYSPLKTDTVVSGAVTVDFYDGNSHYIVLGNGANTITLSNPDSGANYKIYLKQPASGAAGTVTFSPVPLWPSGIAPTLTVTNSALDIVYLGYDGTASKYDADVSLDVK